MYIIWVIDCMEDSRQDYPSSNRWISPRTIDLGRNSLRLWMRTSLNPWTNSPYETLVLLVQKAPETQSIVEDPRNQGKTCARPRAMCAMLPRKGGVAGWELKPKQWQNRRNIMKLFISEGWTTILFHPNPVQTEGPVSCSACVLSLPFIPYERSGLPNGHGKKEIVSPSQYQKEQRTKYSKAKQKKHCKKNVHYNLKLSYHSSHEYRPCYV